MPNPPDISDLPFRPESEVNDPAPQKHEVQAGSPAVPTQSKIPTAFVRLSAILKPIPAAECHLILKNWEAGIVTEVIRALPEIGKIFKKTILNERGEEVTVELQDELVFPDTRFNAWLHQQRQESRYTVLEHVGNLETNVSRLEQQEDDFERLLALRRLRLSKEKASRRGRKPQ